MADNEAKGDALIQDAEKKMTGSKGFLGGLFGWVKAISCIFDFLKNQSLRFHGKLIIFLKGSQQTRWSSGIVWQGCQSV